ncbi:ribosome-binding factor A [Williamsoniiplasma somnilux]|uniref:Ribosome-binding factor A n=1 Tax=Williamsoniiplasma somnilux TaxID=215578 RepID=A0A2K8NZQ7_9MOLU|nr:30S ribosome-binding factor RbfA [Williamsoniiplasma somnilux]ATZ18698.1 ribosome-binding factor A [Williamsoniiplasma somnilux]
MGNYKISARKESLILRELTLILSRELQNPILNSISISEVRLTHDQELAKIYYSFIVFTNSDITLEKVTEELEKHHKKIRRLLAAKVKMRAVPDLEFIYDTSLDNANKIEKILNDLKK